MVQVFRHTVYKRHYAGRCSLAYFYKFVRFVILLLVPFLIAYNTRSFWKKTGSYREQPAVMFKHELLFVAEGATPGDIIFYSTDEYINQIAGSQIVRVPTIQASEQDMDSDGRIDRFEVSVRLPLTATDSVQKVSAALFFEVALTESVQLTMESMVFVQESTSLPSSRLDIFGDLAFVQRNPLSLSSRRTSYEGSIIGTPQTLQDVLLPKILERNWERNETTTLSNVHSSWTGGVPVGNSGEFELKLHLNIPEQTIQYTPNFLETVKFGWVQYLAIWAIVFVILEWASRYIFEHQLVDTMVRTDGVKNKAV